MNVQAPVFAIAVRSFAACAVVMIATSTEAADLPPHGPLRVLIVSDEVNPHGLSDAELTQPGDLLAAISSPASGINLDPAPDGIVEIATDDLAMATSALSAPFESAASYDVVVYFAHRIPNGAGGATLQAAFVAAVDAYLTAGGGFVSFHHGSYRSSGKEALMDLIGAEATGGVPWDTVDGQNVINVAPGHFVTTNGVDYSATVSFEDAGRGIPLGTYSLFNNTPDERYPNLDFVPAASGIEVLYASDYNQGGTTHLLGFTHQRPEWDGIVVAYQPGEYQPSALDDLSGNGFQILANAIVFAAGGGASVPAIGKLGTAFLAIALLCCAVAMPRRTWAAR